MRQRVASALNVVSWIAAVMIALAWIAWRVYNELPHAR
jgi:hypothetical protein